MNLYAHQREAIDFLVKRNGALLTLDMGLGKTRCALVAAQQLFAAKKIDRVVVLCPAAVRISWAEEIDKLNADQYGAYSLGRYDVKKQEFFFQSHEARNVEEWGKHAVPVTLVSYALLPQARHVTALRKWCAEGKTLLVCDESSFLKSRTAKQTKGSAVIARASKYCWLLTGTPIANSPLDLYGQALVMSNGDGPLKGFSNFYHFRARYAQLVTQYMGKKSFQTVVGYQYLDELTERFRPYVLRRTKSECLDLPPKTFEVREVALSEATWRTYQELKRDALLNLGNGNIRPEPNAAVRITRLAQLTSGYAGQVISGDDPECMENQGRDVSSEKLDWVVNEVLSGELSDEQAIVIWTRWRRESIRLQEMFATKIEVYRIFGGQQDKHRSFDVQAFQTSAKRRVMIAQVHAGGFGITLHAASTAIYLSNSFSHVDRVQSSDRIHRIGQHHPCLYLDVLACGPKSQPSIDHYILKALNEKKNISEITCDAWREVLQ